jgi:hypothetical protein
MAPRSKDKRLRLLEPLATDMAAFRAALGMGVTEIGIIRDAVRAFIDWRLKDEEFKKKFESERKKIIETRRQPIRVIRNGDTSA